MRKILLSLVFFVAVWFVGYSSASSGWSTFQSTGVCISTGPNLELLRIRWSSGSSSLGDSYMVAVDSNILAARNSGTCNGESQTPQLDYSLALFPVSQEIIPPVMLYTTSTAGTDNTSGVNNVIDLTNPDGSGKQIRNGLTIFKQGTDYGTRFTVEYRRKR